MRGEVFTKVMWEKMSNLIQCLRCKQSIIKEEWDNHVCSRHFKGVKNIEVLQWWETTNEKGERMAFGIGSDGYTYTMTELKEGFIEIDLSNRDLTGEKNYRRPNSSLTQ